MFEKDMTVGLLLDFYGDVLSEHTRSLLYMYYGEDLSLSEIAESAGISRQGVRHAIKKGEEELRFLEKQLGLAAQFDALKDTAGKLRALAACIKESGDPAVRALQEEALRCADIILSETEEEDTGIVPEFN
ncbi:MAG: DNA-binding protein [Clostridia bacterium]|nr:DNA-binding protein [Clostridia bacterium]